MSKIINTITATFELCPANSGKLPEATLAAPTKEMLKIKIHSQIVKEVLNSNE